ncbi:TPA: hypothetical protein ACPZRZ_002660 [Yersinia enterocolitica]|nr:hypothetical protein [Yersinia enterocolitica]ELW7359362.1 hypothetical protein [Yersinia enterocolitica]
MNRTDDPKKQPIPFGVNGPREDIGPTTPTGDNSASYNSGFPPITMLLKAAGGLPPKGQDMNQILYELSSLARWASAGALNVFDSTFSSSISGYPKGAVLSNSTFTGCWLNTTDANTANPENTDGTLTGWVPAFTYGTTAVTGLAAANVTLTALQAANERITLAGVLTANINLIFPSWRKEWVVVNNCTGSFSVTCKTPGGTGIAVAAGGSVRIIGDGTNIISNESSLITGALQKSANLSDLQSTSTARTNLGLGGAAVLNVGTTVGTVAAGDDPRITASLLKANNLSDLTNVPAALLNLGLGDAAKRGVGKSANQIPDISYFLANLGFSGHQDVPSLDVAGNLGLRWGTMAAMTAGPGQTVTFTRPFSSNCVFAIAFLIRPGSTNTGTSETMYLVSKSATQATFSKGGSESYSAIYLALGY